MTATPDDIAALFLAGQIPLSVYLCLATGGPAHDPERSVRLAAWPDAAPAFTFTATTR